MRGQVVTLIGDVGRVLVYALILFVVIGAIIGANLIDNSNPFYNTWNNFVTYGNTAFTLAAVAMIAIVGYWVLRRVL